MLGNYILSGKSQAITAITVSTLVSLLLPPLAFLICGSVVALMTLRKGVTVVLQILAASLIMLMAFSLLVNLPIKLVLVYIFIIWIPAWSVAMVLRFFEQQGLLLVASGVLATMLIVAIYLVVGDVSGWWEQWMAVMIEKTVPPENISQYKELLEPAVDMVNALMISGFMLNVIMSVLFARWWQSRLFNPGAFQEEFYALRLPSQILPVSGLVVLLLLLLSQPWQDLFRDIMVVLMFMYLIQGISSVHRNVDKLMLSRAWIVSMYCLLILLPQMGLFIACLGMTEVYVIWHRRKFGSKTGL